MTVHSGRFVHKKVRLTNLFEGTKKAPQPEGQGAILVIQESSQ